MIIFLSSISSFLWAYNNLFNFLISSTYALRSPNNFLSYCIAWKLLLIVDCWERRVALAGPGVGDGNVSSINCFLVFWRITLVGVLAIPWLLVVFLHKVITGCSLRVLKWAEERFSSLFKSLFQVSVHSSTSLLYSSNNIFSSFNYFSLSCHAYLPRLKSSDSFTLLLGNLFLAFCKLAAGIASFNLGRNTIKTQKMQKT